LECFLPFLLRTWAVVEVVLLVAEIGAEEAVRAPDAVFDEYAVGAVAAVLGITDTVAIFAVRELVAPLALMRVAAVETVLRFLDPVAVGTVLAVARFADEVGIFAVRDRLTVVTVLIEHPDDAELRCTSHECVKLREEWFIWVIVDPRRTVVTFVVEPTGLAENFVGTRRRKDRDERVSAGIAGALIEHVVVDMCMASDMATIRAPGRRRNVDALVESEIHVADHEGIAAVAAVSFHWSDSSGMDGDISISGTTGGVRVAEAQAG
jgi:hypothetical protein